MSFHNLNDPLDATCKIAREYEKYIDRTASQQRKPKERALSSDLYDFEESKLPSSSTPSLKEAVKVLADTAMTVIRNVLSDEKSSED